MLFGYIQGGNLFPEPLTSEEERYYLIQMSKGDEEARNISIGTVGLIKGIKSFNVEKGARLSTYVSRCIDNEILMHLRATKKLRS